MRLWRVLSWSTHSSPPQSSPNISVKSGTYQHITGPDSAAAPRSTEIVIPKLMLSDMSLRQKSTGLPDMPPRQKSAGLDIGPRQRSIGLHLPYLNTETPRVSDSHSCASSRSHTPFCALSGRPHPLSLAALSQWPRPPATWRCHPLPPRLPRSPTPSHWPVALAHDICTRAAGFGGGRVSSSHSPCPPPPPASNCLTNCSQT